MQVPLLLLAILGAMFIRLESSSAPNSPPPVSFRAILACFSVPSDPTPTPTPEPTPTPTPTPTPYPCADWEAPPLISDSGSSPASFRGHSGEWYADNPPEEVELDEDDLNILVEHASVWGYRTGYLGFEEPEPDEPRNVYLTMDKTKKTTVRRTQGDSIRTCGSYEETTTDSYDNTQETHSWQSTTVTGSHWLWHYANHIQTDTLRTSGSDYENVLYTTTLSQPYEVPAFRSDLESLEPFIDVFHQSWLNHHVYVWTNEFQTHSDVDMVRFKWKWGANVAPEDRYAPPTYLVVFIPPDDPETEDIDESENAEIIKTISWTTWDTSTESAVYEINPFEHKGLERGEYRLLPIDIKVHQTQNGPQGSAPKYDNAPQAYIASNLFSVWPNEEAIVKVKLQPPFDQPRNLPANLVKWEVPGHTIRDNTLEAPLSWTLGFGNNTKEVKITIGGSEFKLHFKVQGVGILSELEAAALVPNASPIMLAYRQEAIDFGTTYPAGPQDDAMRHAYWCSVSVSTFPVTAGDVDLISTGHEYSNRYDDQQQAFNSTMDLKNNAVGMSVNHQVNGLPDRAAIRTELEQRYNAGEMYIWEIPRGAPSRLQQDSEGILIKSNGSRIH